MKLCLSFPALAIVNPRPSESLVKSVLNAKSSNDNDIELEDNECECIDGKSADPDCECPADDASEELEEELDLSPVNLDVAAAADPESPSELRKLIGHTKEQVKRYVDARDKEGEMFKGEQKALNEMYGETNLKKSLESGKNFPEKVSEKIPSLKSPDPDKSDVKASVSGLKKSKKKLAKLKFGKTAAKKATLKFGKSSAKKSKYRKAKKSKQLSKNGKSLSESEVLDLVNKMLNQKLSDIKHRSEHYKFSPTHNSAVRLNDSPRSPLLTTLVKKKQSQDPGEVMNPDAPPVPTSVSVPDEPAAVGSASNAPREGSLEDLQLKLQSVQDRLARLRAEIALWSDHDSWNEKMIKDKDAVGLEMKSPALGDMLGDIRYELHQLTVPVFVEVLTDKIEMLLREEKELKERIEALKYRSKKDSKKLSSDKTETWVILLPLLICAVGIAIYAGIQRGGR